MRYFPQNLSRKTLSRQLVILNCGLSSCTLWYHTTGWWAGQYHQAQTRIHPWSIVVRMITYIQVQPSKLENICFNRHPVPFKCIIKPRTPAAEKLIRDCVNDAGWRLRGGDSRTTVTDIALNIVLYYSETGPLSIDLAWCVCSWIS